MHGGRGQSEVLGTALILALTLSGAALVVTFGGDAVDRTSQELTGQAAENEMTLFDTRIAVTTLGRSSPQTVQLRESAGGSYVIDGQRGWLRVKHVNATGSGNETVYNRTLGRVVYDRDGATDIAYQAGGVWRGDEGGSNMVSPPELHYRRSTLTLPVIRVAGDGSASGSITARVVNTRRNHPVYPNGSATYDGTTRAYRNPVENGSVQVTVHSAYYEAWADYFSTRTDGNVTTVDHDAETATLELTTVGTFGEFSMPGDGGAIRIRGQDQGHAINNFSFTLRPDGDSADFANMEWSLEASSGSRTFELRLESDGGKICNNGNIDAYIEYGDASTATQVWKADDPFKTSGNGFTYECSGDPSLTVDLTDSSNATEFGYREGPDPLNFTAHGVDTRGPYASGDAETAKFLVGHYLGLFDSNLNLVVEDASKGNNNKKSASGSVSEAQSSGFLKYKTGDRVVTYIRVTDNEVDVEFI